MKCNGDEFETLKRKKGILSVKLMALFGDSNIRNALSQNSWKITNVNLRFNKFEQTFNEVLADA